VSAHISIKTISLPNETSIKTDKSKYFYRLITFCVPHSCIVPNNVIKRFSPLLLIYSSSLSLSACHAESSSFVALLTTERKTRRSAKRRILSIGSVFDRRVSCSAYTLSNNLIILLGVPRTSEVSGCPTGSVLSVSHLSILAIISKTKSLRFRGMITVVY